MINYILSITLILFFIPADLAYALSRNERDSIKADLEIYLKEKLTGYSRITLTA